MVSDHPRASQACAVHAVDAAGVHPLLLAIGSGIRALRKSRRVRELLTLANALLGQGQLSLAKYLLIVAGEDSPELDIRHVPDFLRHLLERVDGGGISLPDVHHHRHPRYSGEGSTGFKGGDCRRRPRAENLPVAIDSRIKMPSEGGFGNRVVLRDSRRRRAAFKPDEAGRDPAVPSAWLSTAPTRSTAFP